MEIYAFLLIGGIWAAFLLPSLMEGRRSAPASSTRSFARSKDLLASVATDQRHVTQRKRANLKRQRILVALIIGAAVTLAAAIVLASPALLALTIGFDLAVAAYVTVLLQARQQPVATNVVQLRVVEDEEPATVRVVAG